MEERYFFERKPDGGEYNIYRRLKGGAKDGVAAVVARAFLHEDAELIVAALNKWDKGGSV